MVIITKTIINDFGAKYPSAVGSLNSWYEIAKNANWKSFNDIKKSFNSVDSVGNDHYIFNIRGNECRLIVMIFFNIRTIYVRFIGTHSEYNK